MKNILSKIIFLFCIYLVITYGKVSGQCVWQTELTDGFEYTTTVPYVIPGTTIHTTPQSFAVHSGTYSLYMNFVNCVGGTGTCAGAKVYERPFQVCPNMPLRFSAWLTTSFSGTQCNMRIEIKDANGTVLNNQANIAAPYSPLWTQYQSGAVVPITDTVYFTMYTNVGGGGGNDLSMDDFMLEKCIGGENSTTAGTICANDNGEDLFTIAQGLTDTTGTWSGPSTLTGGYHGTFIPGTSVPGTYVYLNAPYGTGPGCPLAYDSVTVSLIQPPAVNLGADTTICTNQTMLLNAGTGTGYTYLWNNGVTGPTVLAFTGSTTTVTNTYSVVVTAPNGCSNRDTVHVTFQVCSGLNENSDENMFSIYPVPSNGTVYIQLNDIISADTPYSIFNSQGKLVTNGIVNGKNSSFTISSPGIYWIQFKNQNGDTIVRKLIISEKN